MTAKTALCLALVLIVSFSLGGCWSYRSLNEINVVAGVAVDEGEREGAFDLTFEIIDLTRTSEDKGVETKVIESQGALFFDAARNAKMRLASKLYFGNTQIVVISEQLAKDQDIGGIIDFFLRNSECRETIYLVVSKGGDARDILKTRGLDQSVLSFAIARILSGDRITNASTKSVKLYEVYNILAAPGKELTVPIVHAVRNGEERTCALWGTAVYKGDRMIGSLNAEDSKYALFAMDQIGGGLLTFPFSQQGREDVCLEIYESGTKISFAVEDGMPRFTVRVRTNTHLRELIGRMDLNQPEMQNSLQIAASDMLERSIREVIANVQRELKSDIFGFGNAVYKKDPELWAQLSGRWDELFPELKIDVEAEVRITTASSLRKASD